MSHHSGEAYAKRRVHGRYDPTRKATMPSNGLAIPPVTRNVRTAMAVVDDPMEPGRELYVSTNRMVDILEMERSHKRISEAAYRLGRDLQQVFEAGSRMGSGAMWREGDRIDAAQAKEHAIVRNVDIARAIDDEMKRLTSEVGQLGATFLRRILTGTTFAAYAGEGATRAEVAVVAGRFRSMVEEIVLSREAIGRARGTMRGSSGGEEIASGRATWPKPDASTSAMTVLEH